MTENLDSVIAQNIQVAMAKAGLNQAVLSELTGIKKSRLSNIIKGTASLNSIELFQLSRMFGVSTEWFAEEHLSEVKLTAA